MSGKYSIENFLEACGSPGPLNLSVDDANRSDPRRVVLHQPYVIIGRDPGADLQFDHWRVSRRHAYLQLVAGRLFCVDLGSRTGTTWDDGATTSGWLDPGRLVKIGPHEIGRWYEGRQAEPEPIDGPGYDLEFLTLASRQPTIRVSQGLSIVGSSAECRVRLPHSDVSKAHCGLVRTSRGVWAVDLLGRGGIYVNETHVRFARLDDGDELRIGRHVLRFRLPEPDRPARPASPPSKSRAIARRSDDEIPSRPSRSSGSIPAMPSTTLPAVPAWEYPEGEVHRVLAERPSSQVEMVQALMQPMVAQFGLMQQQMFEQFHQAMMGMFQTFGAFYRDQMADLRDELDEVRRLTQELQELQAEARLRESTATASPIPAPPPPPASPPRPAPPIPEYATPPTPVEPARPAPRAETAPPPTSPESTPPPPPRPRPPHNVAPRAEAAPPPPASTPTMPRKPPTRTDPNVHSVLFDRISQLQNERQTRWQKILGMLHKNPD